jgi:hypothetical protein
MRGSITFKSRANFISSCPTIAVKGKTARESADISRWDKGLKRKQPLRKPVKELFYYRDAGGVLLENLPQTRIVVGFCWNLSQRLRSMVGALLL